VTVDAVRPGDRLLVRPGELVPVDAVVEDGDSWLDTSRLTGEAVPVDVAAGSAIMSASINGDRPLTIRATALATDSQYARIVQLVRSAQASKAPLQRLADRYAIWFTPVTLLVCAIAFALTHDWTRVLAVLVVATPCPLILATPVAIVGGVSHAARHGIIVRHGAALESVAGITAAIFDKTGTLTVGQPVVSHVVPSPPFDKTTVLHLAAAVEQGSGHLLARSIVGAAQSAGSRLLTASDVTEIPGRGVRGTVRGRRVLVGSRSLVLEQTPVTAGELRSVERGEVMLRAFVIVDDAPAGAIEFADELRPGVPGTLRRLQDLGIRRTLLLSGDNPAYVARIAADVGIAEAHGNLLPEGKVEFITTLQAAGEQVLMVGDGVNDAPALSRANVGIALAAHGRGIASESADIVLLKDDVVGAADAIDVGRKTMRIARQSIVVGLGLSIVAMGFAAAGMITPVAGALIQEGIDVAVIINALRTSR
ncbi:MAG TPA: heavy metal translocating P-type ATPase, partial [Gemmatimonadaceae bacterium]|nr:heavy metal translocating P-type ATPase [Gemmatimonadaceae bacterium]